MVGADVHEASVGGNVVDPVRNRFSDGVVGKIVNINQLGFILWVPLAARVLEVADQFLLFGVHRDERALFYVASTRARKELLVTGGGKPSRLLTDLQEA